MHTTIRKSRYKEIVEELIERESTVNDYTNLPIDTERSELMRISDVHRLEAVAVKLNYMEKDIRINSRVLMLLLLLQEYKYASREYLLVKLGFLTYHTAKRFFTEVAKSGLVVVVRTRTIGLRNGSTYYLSKKGIEMAERVRAVLESGDYMGLTIPLDNKLKRIKKKNEKSN